MRFSFIKHPVLRFIVKFILFFSLLYYFIQFYEGITSPSGYYASFLDHYVNFINWYRSFLLETAHFLINYFGYPNIVSDKYHIEVIGGNRIQLVYSCLGFGLMAVWFAFLLSYPSAWRKKINWSIIGFAIITLLNLIRITVLTIVIARLKKINISWHHDLYNMVVYFLIIIMIYIYTKEKKKNNLLE